MDDAPRRIMNPLVIEGGRLLAPALLAAAKSIPTSQLARFGLLRGPLVGFGPIGVAFIGGVAATALMIPESRKWLLERAARAIPRTRPDVLPATTPEERGE